MTSTTIGTHRDSGSADRPAHVMPRAALLLATLILSAGWVWPMSVSHPSHVAIMGAPGSYELVVNGKPFYIRGVSFSVNEGPDDPPEFLTPARLRFHFNRIREMGGNTIRRYGDNPDTRAVLDQAWNSGLMVLAGFWLDHDVDYLRDHRRLDTYRHEVRRWALKYKDHPGVLMWVLGNETWGKLKEEFPRVAELNPRRVAYYKFVDELARIIKAVDPYHPIMTVDEHIPDGISSHAGIERSLAMFQELTSSVDVFGINSYFNQDISALQDIVRRSNLMRPYLVSEFGPPGYWLPNRVADDLGQPLEPSDFQKAAAYLGNWQQHILPHRGWNVGGNAFVWKDKKEGSFSWFGLTDSKDRLKPAYWVLRKAWTGQAPPVERPLVAEFTINKKWLSPTESFVVRTRLAPALNPTDYVYTYLIAPAAMTHVDTQFTTNLPQMSLQAPGTPGVYRVYVYVTTKRKDWVSTGSTTFAVQAVPGQH